MSKILPTKDIVTMLASAPPRIAVATKGAKVAQLQATPAPGEWSANEILAHLRACADMWGGAIVTILAQDHPTIRALNPRTWLERTDYRQQKFGKQLEAYTAQREALVAQLAELSPKQWTRAATVTGAGKALERSVHFYAQWMAEHERAHVKQIERLILKLGASA